MILGAIGLSLAALGYAANKSNKLDEKALKKYAKAFEKSEEANLKIKERETKADKRLINVAKKKRAIIDYTVPKFIDTYGKIQKLNIEIDSNLIDFSNKNKIEKLKSLDNLSIYIKSGFTDKELVCGMLTKGFCGMMIKDSERYLSAANGQMSIARTFESQSETICTIYDGIISRADRLADLLLKLNVLFLKSIEKTEETIRKNGLCIHKYSDFEKGILMTCANIAVAISDIIAVPIISESGEFFEAAIEAIKTGEDFLQKMNAIVVEY